jgi:hypothetical protein
MSRLLNYCILYFISNLVNDMEAAAELVDDFPFSRGWSLALWMLRKTHVYDGDIEICRGRLLGAVGSFEDDDVISEDTNPMKAPPQSDHSMVASMLVNSMVSPSTRSSSASEVGSARVEELSTTGQGEAANALIKRPKKGNNSRVC